MSSPAWATPKPRSQVQSNENASRSQASLAATTPAAPPSAASPQQEAPYLTHLVKHHGQFTLTAPDNAGQRRKPASERAREREKIETQPQASTSSLSLELLPSREDPEEAEGAQKVRKKKKKVKKPKGVDPSIMDAVVNAGRPATTSPPLERGGSSQSLPPASIRSATQVIEERPPRTRRPRTSRETASQPSLRQDPSPRRQLEGPRRPWGPSENFDSHHDLIASMPAEAPPEYRPESPPPPHTAPAVQRPPSPPRIVPPTPPPEIERDLPSPPVPDEPPDDDFDVVEEDDPFVKAWEEDRAAGLPLEERIERDLERRRLACQEESILPPPELQTEFSHAADDPTPSSSNIQEGSSLPPLVEASEESLSVEKGAPSPEDLEDVNALALRALEIAAAESSQDAPRIARALSMYAGRKFADAAERRRRHVRMGSGLVMDKLRETSEPATDNQEVAARTQESSIPSTTTASSSAPPISVSPMTAAPRPLSGVAEADIESGDSEEEEDDATPARSAWSTDGAEARRRFAEAAERRMALQKLTGTSSSDGDTEPNVPQKDELSMPAIAEDQMSQAGPVSTSSQLLPASDLRRPASANKSALSDAVEIESRVNRTSPFSYVRPFGTTQASSGATNAPATQPTSPAVQVSTPHPPLATISQGLPNVSPQPAPTRQPPPIPLPRRNPSVSSQSSSSPRSPRDSLRTNAVDGRRTSVSSSNLNPSVLSYIPPQERNALIEPLVPRVLPATSMGEDSFSIPSRRRPAPPPPTRAAPPPSPPTTPPPLPRRPPSLSSPAAARPVSVDSISSLERATRPLPVPPERSGRMDALTALRMAGMLPPTSQPLPEHVEGPSMPTPPPVTVASTASISAARGNLAPPAESMRRTNSASSLLIEPEGTRPERPEAAAVQEPAAQLPDDYVYTDLDILLSRLERDQRNGDNYDDLVRVGDFIGQAQSAGCTDPEIESLPFAPVELERRRIDKQGRVKTKMSIVGVRCVDCNICLMRFKVGELAVALPGCLHVYHAKCIKTWLHMSRICPVCREEPLGPRPMIEL